MTLAPAHAVVAPIVLPIATAALLLLVREHRHGVKAGIAFAATLALVACATVLCLAADTAAPLVYRLGAWPAPYGIVLVADRLAAMMVLLASVIGLASLVFATARWQRAGPRFHVLLQVLLAGVNGAFLTGDLFNLFVFFELLLAASYGLALHGAGAERVQASLHYIVINLVASLLFLLGAAMLYGATGTLNYADLAVRIPRVAAADRALLEAGAALLGVAFLAKAGAWPLCFWLPRTYAAASAPSAACFSILTKVGVYALLRVSLLCFGDSAGDSARYGRDVLVAAGALTIAFGAIGVYGAQQLARLAAFGLLVSSGTLLAAIGAGQAAVSAAALYYLVASTLGASALFLLVEPIERMREPGADVIAITAEAFGSFEAEEGADDAVDVGVPIPASWALLGVAFVACVLLLAGLPPMPGFVGKFSLLHALLQPDAVAPWRWVLLGLLLFAGFATVVAASRTGVRIFWAPERPAAPRVRVVEFAPVALLLLACMALTVGAPSALRYAQDAAGALHAPAAYIEAVLR